MWVFGFLQSATRLIAVVEANKNTFSTTWTSFALVLTFESCLGIEYWLFGLEFYLASIAIEEKLKGKRAANSLLKKKKTCIFWTVSFLYVIVIAGCSFEQKKLN